MCAPPGGAEAQAEAGVLIRRSIPEPDKLPFHLTHARDDGHRKPLMARGYSRSLALVH